MNPSLRERILGSLLGGALGDAWGTLYEGQKGPVQFVVPDRPFVSDDTQLTFATCESIINLGAVDPAHLAAHFLRWFTAGRVRGIGASTLKAFRDLQVGTHWALAGAKGEFAAGNGAAMRIAPLAFLLDPDVREDRAIIRDVCHITHRNDEAYVGALAVILAIRAVLSGEWSERRSFLQAVIEKLPDSAVRDRMEQLLPLQISASEVAVRFGASGYVVDTVPLALYCAQNIVAQPFESILALAISCGGDTDTTASIAGQVAGTVVGVTSINPELVQRIEDSEEITAIANQFADFACGASQRF